MHSFKGYFGVYFHRCLETRDMNTKVILLWVHKQFAILVHILFYINLQTIGVINATKTATYNNK